MEKPQPAAGQTWKGDTHSWTLTKPRDGGWECVSDDGEQSWAGPSWFYKDYVSFAAPPPAQSVGELPDGTPAACLGCGKQWSRINSSFVCDDCCGKLTRPDRTCKCGQMIHAWRDGERNFPRPPTPTETPAPGELTLENCTVGVGHEPLCRFQRGGSCNCFKGAAAANSGLAGKIKELFDAGKVTIPAGYRYGGFLTPSNWYIGIDPGFETKPSLAPARELVSSPSAASLARVGNQSALERIQAKRTPEPWVPSVDDWDLLPDAGR